MVRDGSVDEVVQLCHAIPEFKHPYPKEEFDRRLSQKDSILLIAEKQGASVGFKCGYPGDASDTFYSWMGGVMPENRKEGFALELLTEMEMRAKSKGYKYLSFKTLNEHQAMLIFALKHGFEIVDVTRSSKDSRPRIWLTKQL